MQILTLDLENVKSYERAHITFTGGVNAIVGHNGAGKSTILEAIGYTLFDALDYNQAEFIRGGAKSARMAVTFVSSADERVYTVERRIGSGSRYIVSDPSLGAPLCEGKADVLRFLHEHLQVDPTTDLASIFKDAVGVPQGTLTAAFLLGAPDRKRIFESLLRVEEYTRVWEKLREPLNLLKSRRNEVDTQISHLQGRLERLPVVETEIAERERSLTLMQRQLGEAVRELDGVDATLAKLEGARQEVDRAKSHYLDAQGKAQTMLARHQAAEQRCKEAEAAQKLVAEHQAGFDVYVEAERSRKELEARARQLAQLQTKAATLDKQVALHDAKIASLSKEMDAIVAAEKRVVELSAAVIEQTRLEGERERAGQQQARSKDLQRVISQQQVQLQSAETRRAELLSQLGEAQSVEQQVRTATVQIDERQKALLGERETLAHLKSQAEIIKEQSQRLEDVQTSTCPLCEQPLTPSHRQEMLKRNNRRVEEMRARYREASKQVQTLEAALQAEQVALKQQQDRLLRLPRPDEASKLDEEIARAKAQLDENMKQLATFGDATKQLDEIEQALAALGNPASEHNVAQARAMQRGSVESQLESATRERENAQTQLGEVQLALAQFGNLDAEQEAIAATQQKHAQSYKTVLANQQKALEVAARMQEVATLAQEVKTLVERCAEHERAYKAATANFDEHAYAQSRDRSATLQREVGTLRGQLKTMQEQQEKAKIELAELRSLSAEVAAVEARKKQLLEEEDVLETIRVKLRDAGPYISQALNRQISDGARQIFSDLMQDYSRNLSWNKDYSISLEVDGRERSFSQLSGGEQMSAALSVRLALLREMSNIDVAFFDEPTANLDEVRREALARQILNVRGFRQLFVISHDDTFEQATQNLIRVERVDGASRILTH